MRNSALVVLGCLLVLALALGAQAAPRSGSPFAGTYDYPFTYTDPDSSFTIRIDDRGNLRGTFTQRSLVDPGFGSKPGRDHYSLRINYDGVVDDDGRMIAVATYGTGSVQFPWEGWVSLDANGDLEILLDGATEPFVMLRR